MNSSSSTMATSTPTSSNLPAAAGHAGNVKRPTPRGESTCRRKVPKRKRRAKEQIIKCEQCKKTFSRRGNLIRHLKLHLGLKPFECSKCLRKFATKSNLDSHVRVHQKPSVYFCKFCSKPFKRPGFLAKHELTHLNPKPKITKMKKEKKKTTMKKNFICVKPEPKPKPIMGPLSYARATDEMYMNFDLVSFEVDPFINSQPFSPAAPLWPGTILGYEFFLFVREIEDI